MFIDPGKGIKEYGYMYEENEEMLCDKVISLAHKLQRHWNSYLFSLRIVSSNKDYVSSVEPGRMASEWEGIYSQDNYMLTNRI